MNNTLKHVAIIMDGNGRWATNRGFKRSRGHKEGAKNLEKLALYANKIGIEVLSVYAFSTDNFKRSKEEVDYLMDLLVDYFNNKLDKVIKKGIKIVVSGRRDNLEEKVLNAIDNVINRTKNNQNGILNICINYGACEEIIDATLKIHKLIGEKKITEDSINRLTFSKYLYNDLPAIDLLIRTGGEKRLSNFMLYQASYAEIIFNETLFPDYNEKEFQKDLEIYSNRDRRFGGINYETKKNNRIN